MSPKDAEEQSDRTKKNDSKDILEVKQKIDGSS